MTRCGEVCYSEKEVSSEVANEYHRPIQFSGDTNFNRIYLKVYPANILKQRRSTPKDMKKDEYSFQTVDEWHKEMAVNLTKWLGWKVFWVMCIIVVL